jgi:hypothetical protein
VYPWEKHGGDARTHAKEEICGEMQSKRNIPDQKGRVTEQEDSSCETERHPDWINPGEIVSFEYKRQARLLILT